MGPALQFFCHNENTPGCPDYVKLIVEGLGENLQGSAR